MRGANTRRTTGSSPTPIGGGAPSSGRATLRARLLSVFLSTVLLATLVVSVVSALMGFENGRRQVVAQLESVASLKEAEVESWLARMEESLTTLLTEEEVTRIGAAFSAEGVDWVAHPEAQEELLSHFNRLMDQSDLFEELFAMDCRGQVVLSTDPRQQGKIYRHESFFRQGMREEHVQPPVYFPTLQEMSVIVSMPLRETDEGPVAVLAGRADLDVLDAIMTERSGLGATGETYLVGSNHILLSGSRFRSGGEWLYVRTVGANEAIDGHRDGSALYPDYRGVPVVGVYRWLPGLQLGLLAEQDRAEAFRSTYTVIAVNVGIVLLAGLLAVVGALWVTRSIARPLSNLAETAGQIAAGNLEIRTDVGGVSEIGALARAFNSMTEQLRCSIGSLEERVDELKRTERALRTSEELYRGLFEGIPIGLYRAAPSGQILDVNPALVQALGYPDRASLLAADLAALHHDEQEYRRWERQMRERGIVRNFEVRLNRCDGRTIWTRGNARVIRDEEGAVLYYEGNLEDITAARRSQEALQESEERYRTLVEQSNEGIYLLVGQNFAFVNQRFEELFGVTRDEVSAPDFDFMRLIAPQSRREIEERERKIQAGESVSPRYEFTALHADGHEMEMEASVSYIPYGGTIASQGIVRDITARKRAEAELRRRERYLVCLSNVAQDLLKAAHPFEILPQVLAQLGEAVGVRRVVFFENSRDDQGRLVSTLRHEWHSPDLQPRMGDPHWQAFPWEEGGLSSWAEALCRGEMVMGRPADFSPSVQAVLERWDNPMVLLCPLFVSGEWCGTLGLGFRQETAREWEESEITLLSTVVNDIAQAIERSQTEQALQESEERYRWLIDTLPDGIAVHQDGKLVLINQAGAETLGFDSPQELIGRSVLEFVHPEDLPEVMGRIREEMETGVPAPLMEERFLHRDGTVIDVEVLGRPIMLDGRPAALVVAREIGERKRLEKRLRQAQKMEAIGRLAGGVAHDFNNLLTAINGYAEFILTTMDPQGSLRVEVEAILKAGRRAATLTRQLLAFSRRQMMELRVLDLNGMLLDLGRMLRRIISEDIELRMFTAPDLGRIRVDPAQMEQVIVNLVLNARDAMPHGGRLILETTNVELDETYARSRTEVAPGPYVLLSVSDSGRGMDPEVLQHIFEPFFTTKEGGTGLGLATAYGIVKQFGGHIQVYSELDVGTIFRIYLPRVDEPVDPAPVRSEQGAWPKGTETILVVEDNNNVRHLVTRVLQQQGYTVLEARQGGEALQVAEDYPGPIDLLVTDVVMPQMSGWVLAAQLQQSRGVSRILYMSGYAESSMADDGAFEPGSYFIQKPFPPQMLVQRVREILDAEL